MTNATPNKANRISNDDLKNLQVFVRAAEQTVTDMRAEFGRVVENLQDAIAQADGVVEIMRRTLREAEGE